MARNGTFDGKRAQARVLFDAGLSCNAIARTLGCSPSTVSRWAKAEGLHFNRAQTAPAVAAHTFDMAVERLALAREMIEEARIGMQELKGPVMVYSFGGKENTFASQMLDKAPVSMRRELMTTAGIAFDKATRIVEKSDDGLDDALGVMDTLAAGFSEVARIAREQQETPTDGA